MRRFLFILFNLLILSSCSNDKKYEQLNKHWWVYNKARKVNDNLTAINALYQIMYLDSNEFVLKDSIAKLYYEEGELEKCIGSSKESLKYHTQPGTIKLGFNSAKSLGKSEDVLIFGEFLADAEPENLFVRYDLAVHNLKLKSLDEAKNWIDIILANPSSTVQGKEQIQNDGSAITVPLSVCATNLLGVYHWQSGRPDLAKKMFLEAAKRQPNYDVAKDNYASLGPQE